MLGIIIIHIMIPITGDIELTEEEITELHQIIDNASWSSMTAYDRLLSIIWEEAEYFFKGDKNSRRCHKGDSEPHRVDDE